MTTPQTTDSITSYLPAKRDLFYGGEWISPKEGEYVTTINPGTGDGLADVANASTSDVDAALDAANRGFENWREVLPLERARILRQIASIVREHAEELAMLDAANCGNPVGAMIGDAEIAAAQLEFFAGLVTEMKGESIPMGPDRVNFSVREPCGVVAKILPFNHPFMFCAGKIAAPLAAGNTVVVKPPDQAPLSALRFAELIEGLLPAGVFNLVPGGRAVGEALSKDPRVAMVSLIGSVAAGQGVMRNAADTLKPILLELGGKNALIGCADADPKQVARAIAQGMNFTWCGQSCGSTSRAFIHEAIYDQVLEELEVACEDYTPGIPTEKSTTMGAIISQRQYERILDFIRLGKDEGARLLLGDEAPSDEKLKNGFFISPTVFVDVSDDMTIAREEIFGPVLSVLPWRSEAQLVQSVNAVEYGLTCAIWSSDLKQAHRLARSVEAGYIWVNDVSKHFLGAPFGGYKKSGLGREECLEELLSYTQEKNIHINLAAN